MGRFGRKLQRTKNRAEILHYRRTHKFHDAVEYLAKHPNRLEKAIELINQSQVK